MNHKHVFTAAAVAAVLALTSPVYAGHLGGGLGGNFGGGLGGNFGGLGGNAPGGLGGSLNSTSQPIAKATGKADRAASQASSTASQASSVTETSRALSANASKASSPATSTPAPTTQTPAKPSQSASLAGSTDPSVAGGAHTLTTNGGGSLDAQHANGATSVSGTGTAGATLN